MANFSQAGDTFLVEKLLTNSKDKIQCSKIDMKITNLTMRYRERNIFVDTCLTTRER